MRGERPWQALEDGGLSVEFGTAGADVFEEPGIDVVRPTVGDFATGFTALRTSPIELERWASVVLAANHLDLGGLEDCEEGEFVLTALWDAAAGKPPSPEDFVVMERLSSVGQSDGVGDPPERGDE